MEIMIKKSVHHWPSILTYAQVSGGASRNNPHRTLNHMRILIILLFYYTPNSGKIQGLFTENPVFVDYVHFYVNCVMSTCGRTHGWLFCFHPKTPGCCASLAVWTPNMDFAGRLAKSIFGGKQRLPLSVFGHIN